MRFRYSMAWLAITAIALMHARVRAAEPDDLTTYVIKRSSLSFEKLHNCSYVLKEIRSAVQKGTIVTAERSARVIWSGSRSFIDGEFPYTTPINGAMEKKRQRVISVTNDAYCARRAFDFTIAEQYENESPGILSQRGQRVIGIYRPLDLAIVAAGDGERSVEQLTKHLSQLRWTATGPDGAGVFTLFGQRENQKVALFRFQFDSRRDFLLTRYEARDSSGELYATTIVELAQNTAGVWYPKAVERYLFNEGRRELDAKLSISDFVSPPSVPPEQFTMSALDLPNGYTVNFEGKEGGGNLFKVANGQLIQFTPAVPSVSAGAISALDRVAMSGPNKTHSLTSMIAVVVFTAVGLGLLAALYIRRRSH